MVPAGPPELQLALLIDSGAIIVQLQEDSGVVVADLLYDLGGCRFWAHQHFFLHHKQLYNGWLSNGRGEVATGPYSSLYTACCPQSRVSKARQSLP